MPVQDYIGTYTGRTGLGYAGMIAEGQTVKDVASKAVENANLPFGRAVGAGTADGSCRLGGTGYVGITVADKSRANDLYEVGEMAGVMRKGTIWVNVSANVDPSDTVYFVAATGVITSSSSGAVAIPGAKFETTATSGNLARVYLG